MLTLTCKRGFSVFYLMELFRPKPVTAGLGFEIRSQSHERGLGFEIRSQTHESQHGLDLRLMSPTMV